VTRTRPVIAIDGPSGVGKTTVSRLLAQRLGFNYINTGAMYRSVALAADESGVDLESDSEMAAFLSDVKAAYDSEKGAIVLNGHEYSAVTGTQRAGALASVASSKRSVREFLVSFQRTLGEAGGVVMEGRDIGTAVFPDAEVKFFLDASHEIRTKRRHKEPEASEGANSETVSRQLRERDKRDSTRELSPLKAAADAITVDTGTLSIGEVVETLVSALEEKGII